MAEHSSTLGAGRGSTLAAEEGVAGSALVAVAAEPDSLLAAAALRLVLTSAAKTRSLAALRPVPTSAAKTRSLAEAGLLALLAGAYLPSRPAPACLALVGSRA